MSQLDLSLSSAGAFHLCGSDVNTKQGERRDPQGWELGLSVVPVLGSRGEFGGERGCQDEHRGHRHLFILSQADPQ